MAHIYLHHEEGKPVLGAEFYEALGGRLRQVRKTRGLTQEQLSKATGLSKDRLRIFENHRGQPNIQELLILCQHLDVTPNWLLYGTDSLRFAKHIQNNLVTPKGYIDMTDQLVRMSLFYSVLNPTERRALEIVLTSMLRGSGRSDEEIQGMHRMADTLAVAFSNNPFLNDVINKLAADPELIRKIEEAFAGNETPGDS